MCFKDEMCQVYRQGRTAYFKVSLTMLTFSKFSHCSIKSASHNIFSENNRYICIFHTSFKNVFIAAVPCLLTPDSTVLFIWQLTLTSTLGSLLRPEQTCRRRCHPMTTTQTQHCIFTAPGQWSIIYQPCVIQYVLDSLLFSYLRAACVHFSQSSTPWTWKVVNPALQFHVKGVFFITFYVNFYRPWNWYYICNSQLCNTSCSKIIWIILIIFQPLQFADCCLYDTT